MQKPIKVFISYSHDSNGHSARVLGLSNRLKSEGIDCDIDQYLNAPPEEGWLTWMENKIEEADFVLMACTETYLRRYRKKEIPDVGKGSAWEASLIAATFYNSQGRNKKFFPILFDQDDTKHIPLFLTAYNHYLLDKDFPKLKGLLTGTPVTAPVGSEHDQKTIKPFNVPIRRNPFFTGREEILEKIKEELESGNETALTQAISGLGGIGKTQIAAEFAYRQRNVYETILWAEADTKESLSKSIFEFAEILNLPEKNSQKQFIVYRAVKNWLKANKNWLLILDNLEEFDLYEELIPPGTSGHVLITTRLNNVNQIPRVQIDEMLEDGVLLFLRRATILNPNDELKNISDIELTATRKINDLLGGLPVALELAGSFSQQMKKTAVQYLKLFEGHSEEILKETVEGGGYRKSVEEVFKLSFQKTVEENDAVKELIELCAFLDSDTIPDFIFEKGKEHCGDALGAAVENNFQWEKVVETACKYSLVHRNSDGESLRIHRLVQQVVRGSHEKPENIALNAIKVLNESFPNAEFETWELCGFLLPTFQTLQVWIKKWNLETDEVSRLFNCVGTYFLAQGRYEEAEPLYQDALKMRKKLLGDEHPSVATSLNNLAGLYESQGRYEEAEPFFQAALEMRKKLLGEEHPDVATSLNNLAVLYDKQGRYEEAGLLCQDTLMMGKKLLGDEHPSVAMSLNNLAELYRNQGRYEEAEALYQEALEMWKKLLGDEHPSVATSLNNLAVLYDNQGRYEEAEPLYQDILKMWKKLLGDEHPSVATSLNNLGALYCSQGRYEEAEPFFQAALEMSKKLLGDEHPSVAMSLNNLAELYRNQGRYEEAEPLYQDALEMLKKLLGEEHPDVAMSLNNLGGLYCNQGRNEEAEALYQDALKMKKKLFGDEHPDVAMSLNNLAELYRNQGRCEEAEVLYQDALMMRKKLFGEAHPSVPMSLNNLARLYDRQGRYEEAEPLYQDALRILKKIHGEEHPDVSNSLYNLAGLYESQCCYEKAEPLYQDALKMRKKLFGEEHPDVATSLNTLAGLYERQGRYEEAELLHQDALKKWKKLLGEEHPSVAASLNNLAGLYERQGRYEEAELLHQDALKMWRKLLGEEHPDVATSLNNLGVLWANQGNYSQALEYFEEAYDLLARLLGPEHPYSINCKESLEQVRGLME